jgi:hypothetical protein
MTGLISFSLYGEQPIYLNGALQNAKTIPDFYPGWDIVFYVTKDVPKNITKQLENAGSIIKVIDGPSDHRASLYRYLAINMLDYERVIFRDCDSRPNEREVAAVDEWIKSNKKFHIMRDHPSHWAPIMAGMFGAKTGQLYLSYKEIICSSALLNGKGVDQLFLANSWYKQIVTNSEIHDSFYRYEKHSKEFPTKRDSSFSFVGEIYDENDYPDILERVAIRQSMKDLGFIFKALYRSLKHRIKYLILY